MTISILTQTRHAVEGGATGLIAAPQVPSIGEWNALVRAYLCARINDDNERERGAVAQAEDGLNQACAAHPDREHPDRRAAWDAYRAAEDAHEARFSRPRWDAAAAVIRTPAPTMAALVQKIETMEGEGWNGDETDAPGDFAALAADIRRLASEA